MGQVSCSTAEFLVREGATSNKDLVSFFGGEEEGEKEEGRTGGQKPHSLLPSCARAAWHRGKEKGAKLEAREGLGYSPGNTGARSPGHPCKAREGKRISHPGNNFFFKADSGPGGKVGKKNPTKQTKNKKTLDISPHPPRKKKKIEKSFLHVKIPSPFQRHSCSYCFRANIIGYVFSKGAVFQTRWFLSSHRETETTQSQQCSAQRQWHPHFGVRQKDDS